ncbi:helix-turn-helix transcriptional regulator [Sporosarcina koreensis]|uniref:helix-turn-helix transcriptional regulator n=1 Tax=Sporosarcina koreensis TaxID=334735 RepID=UPI0007538036
MINVTLRCQLYDLRTARGWTQYDLEVRTGISEKTISAYENNRRLMNIATMVKFAIALRCSLDDLYDYELS